MLLFLAISASLSGCASRSAQAPRLRISSNGLYTMNNLIVRFPQDSIVFGDVPAGTSTEYKEVSNGVFRYAAYDFEVDGKIITQPVIDWVGETPMEGNLFTYTLDFDPSRVDTGDGVRLVDVKKDD
jgi:hypothetical protein